EPICAPHCCLIAIHPGLASGRMEMAMRYRCEPLTREVTFPGSICRLMTEPLRRYVRPRGSRLLKSLYDSRLSHQALPQNVVAMARPVTFTGDSCVPLPASRCASRNPLARRLATGIHGLS